MDDKADDNDVVDGAEVILDTLVWGWGWGWGWRAVGVSGCGAELEITMWVEVGRLVRRDQHMEAHARHTTKRKSVGKQATSTRW